MRPSCGPFEHELSAFVDGELAAEQRDAVAEHLRGCARCAGEVRELRRVGETLRRWDAQETRYATSTGFRNRVLGRLGHGAHVETAAPAAVSDPAAAAAELRAWRRALWASAAAAGIVGAFAWHLSQPSADVRDELARQQSQVDDLARKVRDLASRTTRPSPAAAEPDLDVARVEAPDPVVGELTERPVPGVASAPAPGDAYEVREPGLIHRGALRDFDDYTESRRRLSLEELAAKVLARGEGRDTVAAAPLSNLARFLSYVSVSDTRFSPFERLQVWPIERPRTTAPVRKVLLLDQAIDEGVVEIREDANGAVVAENRDTKAGGRPIFVLAGDVLRGSRRDRMLREDALLAPGRQISLGAWAASSARRTSYRRFTRSRMVAPADLRALLSTSGLGADLTQRDVDRAVQATMLDLGQSTGGDASLENLWSNPELQGEVLRYVTQFQKRLDRPEVVGFAFAAGPDLVGVELCGDHETFRALRDRLLGSYVLGALARPREALHGAPPPDAAVRALLADAVAAVYDDAPPGSEGTLSVFRAAKGPVFGYGLLDASHVVHASVFAGVRDAAGVAANGGSGRRASELSPGGGVPEGGRDGDVPTPDRSGGAPAGGIDDAR